MSVPKHAAQCFIGAGANLGDRSTTLARAITELRGQPGILALETSPVFETEPLGPAAQPHFLNLVLGVETSLAPEALLALLLDTERHHGRVRTGRWGPRTLDLDLLAYENETRSTPVLELPHPRLFERAFVTVPLRELLAAPRFQRAAWNGLRRQLAGLPTGPGLRRLG